MDGVGVRELRQRASELLRRVEAGERIQINDRGRPVAVLAPIPDDGPIEQLRATGDLVSSRREFDDLPEPLDPGNVDELPSQVLSRLRANER